MGGWISSTGPNLFDFTTGSPSVSGNADFERSIVASDFPVAPGGRLLRGQLAWPLRGGLITCRMALRLFFWARPPTDTGNNPDEAFVLQNVPAGTIRALSLWGELRLITAGTLFTVNSGNAHNGIAATLNSRERHASQPSFVEGQNFVIFENVTPDASGNITITASPNPQDGVGNNNLTE